LTSNGKAANQRLKKKDLKAERKRALKKTRAGGEIPGEGKRKGAEHEKRKIVESKGKRKRGPDKRCRRGKKKERVGVSEKGKPGMSPADAWRRDREGRTGNALSRGKPASGGTPPQERGPVVGTYLALLSGRGGGRSQKNHHT